MERLTVQEAANRLGISEGAVRKRLDRGRLRHEKGVDGRVYVWVDTGQTGGQGDAVAELRAHNATLQEQLAAERRANEENRRIIAALTQRIPEIEAPATETPPDGPESAAAESGRGTGLQEPERPAQRPWWRRMFGG